MSLIKLTYNPNKGAVANITSQLDPITKPISRGVIPRSSAC